MGSQLGDLGLQVVEGHLVTRSRGRRYLTALGLSTLVLATLSVIHGHDCLPNIERTFVTTLPTRCLTRGAVTAAQNGWSWPTLAAVQAQVARVLSLDHDGPELVAVGQRDPVIAAVQELAPGLRPPLLYSPHEAAAWSVLCARRPARQMAEVCRQLSEALGAASTSLADSWRRCPPPRSAADSKRAPGHPRVEAASPSWRGGRCPGGSPRRQPSAGHGLREGHT